MEVGGRVNVERNCVLVGTYCCVLDGTYCCCCGMKVLFGVNGFMVILLACCC